MSRVLYELHASIKPKKRHRVTNHHIDAANELFTALYDFGRGKTDVFGFNKAVLRKSVDVLNDILKNKEKYLKDLGREDLLSSALAFFHLGLHPFLALSEELRDLENVPVNTGKEQEKTDIMNAFARDVVDSVLEYGDIRELKTPLIRPSEDLVALANEVDRRLGFLDEEHRRLLKELLIKFNELYKLLYHPYLDQKLTLYLKNAKILSHDLIVTEKLMLRLSKEDTPAPPGIKGDIARIAQNASQLSEELEREAKKRDDPKLLRASAAFKRRVQNMLPRIIKFLATH